MHNIFLSLIDVSRIILNDQAYLIGAVIVSIVAFTCLSKFFHKIGRDNKQTHGNARFAETDELKEKKLLHNDGSKMVLASQGNEFIGAECHALVVAPTGSGKGVGIIVPTLLTYKGSVVVNDPKGENYTITSRYRESLGQDVV